MEDLLPIITQLADTLLAKKWLVCTAESCTGGWVAQALTQLAGSSQWFERGFVTYSNAAKHEMLGVSEKILADYGAVSVQTAVAMAEGALQHSHAQCSLSVTGIAGPNGGSVEKPVGLVCFAWAQQGRSTVGAQQRFNGDRESIRYQAVVYAIEQLVRHLS